MQQEQHTGETYKRGIDWNRHQRRQPTGTPLQDTSRDPCVDTSKATIFGGDRLYLQQGLLYVGAPDADLLQWYWIGVIPWSPLAEGKLALLIGVGLY